MEMPSTSEGSMSLVNWIRWKVQSMARARAWPSVVLPTPGTPSISRWPLAKMETRARRRTSSLPRMTRRRLFSSSAARREAATRVSGAIVAILLWHRAASGYECHREVLSSRFSVLRKTEHFAWLPVTELWPWRSHNLQWRNYGALVSRLDRMAESYEVRHRNLRSDSAIAERGALRNRQVAASVRFGSE